MIINKVTAESIYKYDVPATYATTLIVANILFGNMLIMYTGGCVGFTAGVIMDGNRTMGVTVAVAWLFWFAIVKRVVFPNLGGTNCTTRLCWSTRRLANVFVGVSCFLAGQVALYTAVKNDRYQSSYRHNLVSVHFCCTITMLFSFSFYWLDSVKSKIAKHINKRMGLTGEVHQESSSISKIGRAHV